MDVLNEAGGPVQPGWSYIVGEQGPKVFVPPVKIIMRTFDSPEHIAQLVREALQHAVSPQPQRAIMPVAERRTVADWAHALREAGVQVY